MTLINDIVDPTQHTFNGSLGMSSSVVTYNKFFESLRSYESIYNITLKYKFIFMASTSDVS